MCSSHLTCSNRSVKSSCLVTSSRGPNGISFASQLDVDFSDSSSNLPRILELKYLVKTTLSWETS